MNQNIKYKKPPLVEAVFELFFFTKNWNSAVPGLFYNEIKDEFNKINTSTNGIDFQINNGQISFGKVPELTQFRNESSDTVIQLSNNLLTINKLPEYQNWETYFKLIKKILEKFEKVIGDFEIKRLGLKFINKINIGDVLNYNHFKNVFNIYPILPDGCEADLKTISLNLEYPDADEKEITAITLNTLRAETGYDAPVLFQLYELRIKEFDIEVDEWISNAHKKLIGFFEKSLKMEIKKSFNEK